MLKLIVLLPLLFQLVGLDTNHMQGAMTVLSPMWEPYHTSGYYVFILDGYQITIQNPPAWLDLAEGKQTVWLAYRNTPSVHFTIGGYMLTLVPSDPLWRNNVKGIAGYERVEPRFIYLTRTPDSLTIKFMTRELPGFVR